MPTETIDPRHADIATRPLPDAVAAMWEGQRRAVAVLESQLGAIAVAAEAMARRLRGGTGRIAYTGAGTSGRIAVQDGVELVPTFGWDPARLVYLMAGGPKALTGAVEGAEDDENAGRAAVGVHGLGSNDVLIALAASGRTPFTCAVLEEARDRGALTVGIANNPDTRLLANASHPILADTGAEVIAGSTRMGAGTAQRAALTMLSSAAMIALGFVHQGRMVAMRPTNAKLRDRAAGMVAELAGVDDSQAEAALARSGGDISIAVLVARGMQIEDAARLLARHEGRLAAALNEGTR
ncbi:MAG TPA: N-acetylmuramic acid 6-phosphate etherase [Qipengyuania sp.]|nr:N-acetylmuramic acid 6-phosphate etherase [Qipengyuania sp.]